jgi:hypothetical protein
MLLKRKIEKKGFSPFSGLKSEIIIKTKLKQQLEPDFCVS